MAMKYTVCALAAIQVWIKYQSCYDFSISILDLASSAVAMHVDLSPFQYLTWQVPWEQQDPPHPPFQNNSWQRSEEKLTLLCRQTGKMLTSFIHKGNEID